ncbi:hypothetical protein D3C85_1471960 [compost metagenome]
MRDGAESGFERLRAGDELVVVRGGGQAHDVLTLAGWREAGFLAVAFVADLPAAAFLAATLVADSPAAAFLAATG